MQVKTLCWFEYFGETLLCFNLPFFDLWNSYIIWANTYETTLKLMFILQTKAVCIITFSKLDSYSCPLLKSLGLIKFFDVALFQIAIIMYKFHNNMLPAAFHSFFTKVTSVQNFNTRFAASYTLTIFFMPETN